MFIYSIVWRASVCNDYGFLPFKLSSSDEEQLRIVLKTFLAPTQAALCNKLVNLNELPHHSHVILRPKKKLRPPQAGLSAVSSIDKSIHLLYLVDYIIMYYPDPAIVIEQLKEIDNNNLENLVKVGLGDPEIWKGTNLDFMNNFLK